MDEKDTQLLQLLVEDSSLSTRELAKRTRIPITTVHNRVKKLQQEGYIKRYTVDVDHKRLGKPFGVLILVNCDYAQLREAGKDQHSLAKHIKELEAVEQVDIVTGGIDMVVRIRVHDVEEYDRFLLKEFQRIPGVDRTQSLVVIREE